MVELVERMMTADSSRLTAYGSDQIDALVYELYGLTEKEIKTVEGEQI
jgi:hypothetical protein